MRIRARVSSISAFVLRGTTRAAALTASGIWFIKVKERSSYAYSPKSATLLSSSMAEHPAVNRRVVGSSPT
jgi:hypothetical protein